MKGSLLTSNWSTGIEVISFTIKDIYDTASDSEVVHSVLLLTTLQ